MRAEPVFSQQGKKTGTDNDRDASLGKQDAAHAMYSDAENLLIKVSPYRARKIRGKKTRVHASSRVEDLGLSQVKRRVTGWINGKAEL
ncbi:hypothetical protein FHX09_004687 [Rhizobium sp. BK538]|nr:hypothetical protein [Rhizobium sp. BK538]